jgi:predicted metal-dependent peptidase
MNKHDEENELAKSLVYWVSRRGANNYWATLINGCDKRYTNEDGTMSVQLTPNWRYLLTCHIPFFEKCSPAMRLLALVHEAAHIALNHIPRLFKLLANCTDPFVRTAIMSTFNWAADFAANDAIVRHEPGFKEAHKAFMHVGPDGAPVPFTKETEAQLSGEWPFLMPEEWGMPVGLSMEEYFVLILKDLPKFKQRIQRMMDDLKDQLEKMGESGEEGDMVSSDGGDIIMSPYGKGRGGLPNSIPGLPNDLIDYAINQPEIFEMMQKAFDRISGKAHKQWNQKAMGMTPEEAVSAGSKMKKHAQSLARSAKERTTRDRGYMAGNIQKIIDMLLEPEQIPWDLFLRDLIQGAITSRIHEEMGSPNLSVINEDSFEPWPGQTLEFGFNITWMTDTSGSMGDDEYARACACINSLLAQNKSVFVTYCECDAAMQKEVKTSNVEPPSEEYLKELQLRRGHGGTVYTPFFRRVAGCDDESDWAQGAPKLDEKHPKPDLMVICTDGGVGLMGECFPKYKPDCPIIWLLMPGCHPVPGMDNVSPDRVVEMFKMKQED